MKALKSLATEVKVGVLGTFHNLSLLQSNAGFQSVEIIPLWRHFKVPWSLTQQQFQTQISGGK